MVFSPEAKHDDDGVDSDHDDDDDGDAMDDGNNVWTMVVVMMIFNHDSDLRTQWYTITQNTTKPHYLRSQRSNPTQPQYPQRSAPGFLFTIRCVLDHNVLRTRVLKPN